MKIVIAPDSFKETLSAKEAAEAIKTGFSVIFPEAEYVLCPMADGGEGTVRALVEATNGRLLKARVKDPLGENRDATFGFLGDGKTAVIEMAEASGIHLLASEERNPLITSSYGTGELMKAALDDGAETLIIGLGGSATNDGGAGMFQALGGKLLDKDGNELSGGGKELLRLETIDVSNLDPRLKKVKIRAACDVNNPLCGLNGASFIYGPQKGATKESVKLLDDALLRYSQLIKTQLHIDIGHVAGAGAAGGLGAGLIAFTGATLETGGKIIADVLSLEEKMKGASFILTGEGEMNGQTINGKTPVTVSRLAAKQQIPVIAICGSVSQGYESVYEEGISSVFSSLPELTSFQEVQENAFMNVQKTSENVARVLKIGLDKK